MNNKTITEVVGKYGTPLYVYDQEQIIKNYKKIYNAFYSRYNKFKICYSIKANNNLALLKLLKNLGAGFDCSSKGEMYLAKKAKSDFISYSGNYNSEDELKYALDKNVNIVNLDGVSILDKLRKIKFPDVLSFRVNPGFVIKDTFFTLSGKDSKFGVPKEKIIEAYKEAKKTGIKKFGIHMMVGSCTLDSSYFEKVAKGLMELVLLIKEQLEIDLAFVNIGGGFGIPYGETEKELDIDDVAFKVTNILKEYVKNHNIKEPTLLIEPGRYIMGNAGYLLGRVQAIKESYKKFVGTDISVNSILRIPLMGANHKIRVLTKEKTTRKEIITLCGQICWEGDILKKDKEYPSLSIGDIIVIHDIGAYGFCHSNHFNTRQRPSEILVANNKYFLIRKREDLTEFDRLVEVPDFLQ